MGLMEKTISSLSEMDSFAGEILNTLLVQEKATVLTLAGDLGAGKTAFTKALAKALGVIETINSPTFVIMKNYKLEKGKFDRLIHIDAYRIEDPKELIVLGFGELLENPKNLLAIEWPEKVAPLIPSTAFEIQFTFIDEKKRSVSFQI